jgi:hypothetical protein
MEKISRCHPVAFIQSQIRPQSAVQRVIVSLFRDRLISRAHRIIARSIRTQMFARFTDIVCGDDKHDLLIQVVHHLLGNDVQRVAVFVRLVMDPVSVVAQDIQKMVGAEDSFQLITKNRAAS